MSRLARALWIEMTPAAANLQFWRSRLARALWIEIFKDMCYRREVKVEARESLVD